MNLLTDGLSVFSVLDSITFVTVQKLRHGFVLKSDRAQLGDHISLFL